ncbi:translation elongation factor Ts [Spirochaeta lutea]|uniref:Elongation factor Ts n=1 Tax=Spirochaeta lutea TaxID=1480694 RepID=A0A098R0V2_9SPIO|nr:translation elongation factor Ts [Spirochaeta lutea]KGE73795.1 elongation factor Ts [Spirochaeta lutea]
MAINAADVKRLREKTGAGMMDCKKALVKADGDFDRAETILKEMGLAAVAKRADRSADEGRVFTYVSPRIAGIMELSCETDFVARNEQFAETGTGMIKDAVESNKNADDAGLQAKATELATTIKENIQLRRLEKMEADATEKIFDYIHGEAGSVGVLVKLRADKAALLSDEQVLTLGKDLTLHAAAFNPPYLNESKVESSYLAEQERIFQAQAANMDKPAQVIQGIVKGKLNKHLKEICFTEQGFVKDEKRSVAQVLKDLSKELGGTIELVDYRVYRAGEAL